MLERPIDEPVLDADAHDVDGPLTESAEPAGAEPAAELEPAMIEAGFDGDELAGDPEVSVEGSVTSVDDDHDATAAASPPRLRLVKNPDPHLIEPEPTPFDIDEVIDGFKLSDDDHDVAVVDDDEAIDDDDGFDHDLDEATDVFDEDDVFDPDAEDDDIEDRPGSMDADEWADEFSDDDDDDFDDDFDEDDDDFDGDFDSALAPPPGYPTQE